MGLNLSESEEGGESGPLDTLTNRANRQEKQTYKQRDVKDKFLHECCPF